ncbi:MAG TPA: V-type ATP synthase subunit B [Alphaproteobacteria bacterium]|nr:V-type ATP synthase subunit B [Alphaproteobacteria bacterium]
MQSTAKVALFTKHYRTLSSVSGPLLVVERVKGIGYGEMVEIQAPAGDVRQGRVLAVDGSRAIVQVFASTRGLDVEATRARFTGEVARLGVAREMLGRMFDGLGQPIDGAPPIVAEKELDITGLPLNPYAREHPAEFIQTGMSAIDGLNTLVRGQKLPIFSCAGLPAAEVAAQIAAQAKVVGLPGSGEAGEPFAVVFAAIGITHREASYFRSQFEASGTLDRAVLFINLANDPTVERLLTPHLALTTAEYLAFEQNLHVLVIITDMLNYAEALREVATAREEVPGRRGYPGYLYTDLASLYERAGRIKGKKGSITQLLILTMPDDDITHPVPDLTGYITEGQLVLSRDLHRRGIYPPLDVLPSLSRLMNAGIGAGKTREDHRHVADQLYALYAQGRDVRRLVAIIGEAALTAEDRRHLEFAEQFEQRFIHQRRLNRELHETLDIAWDLLAVFPAAELKRIRSEYLEKYHRQRIPHA